MVSGGGIMITFMLLGLFTILVFTYVKQKAVGHDEDDPSSIVISISLLVSAFFTNLIYF